MVQQGMPLHADLEHAIDMDEPGIHLGFCRDVVGVGEGVSRLQLGKRVALEPGIPCWGSKIARCFSKQAQACQLGRWQEFSEGSKLHQAIRHAYSGSSESYYGELALGSDTFCPVCLHASMSSRARRR